MIRINLLPYRKRRRREQVLRHLLVALLVIGGAVGLAAAVHGWAASRLESLEERYAELHQKNVVLQRKIGEIRDLDRLRAEVQKKLKLVDDLQQGRFRSFRTLLAIAQSIPQNVWLTQIKDQGATIALSGLAESPKAVANFMRALEAREEFANVRLGVLKRAEMNGAVLRAFDLSFQRLMPGGAAPNPKPKRGR